jgi:transposase, IS5 family
MSTPCWPMKRWSQLSTRALVQRHPQSRRRGRPGFPAEVVLRFLVLKHIRNWSCAALEREVRANLVYRDFTHVGAAKMPDAKTIGRWGVAIRPTVIHQIHDRIVQIARTHDAVQGRSMRVDTEVVENNILYPADSSLLGDGVRVLTRTLRKIAKLTGQAGAALRPGAWGCGQPHQEARSCSLTQFPGFRTHFCR